MEHSFVTTAHQAEQLSDLQGKASINLKRDRFNALGLGLGLADQREALIDLDGRAKLWRLVSVDYDPTAPEVVATTWTPAPIHSV